MDFNKQGMTYILLVIPTLFALTVLGQGIAKLSRKDQDAWVAIGFGSFFLLLIIGTYFFVIR